MQKDFRVLIVDLSRRYGGASVRALNLAFHLRSSGSAIAGLENSPVVKIATERDIPVKIVGRKRADPLIPLRLRKIIREGPFQLIDTQNIQSKFWGSLAIMITNVAFVSTLNSAYGDEQGSSWKGKMYALVDRMTNFNVDRYIVVSQAIKKNLMSNDIPETTIDLITNAVDVDQMLQNADAKQIRQEIGIPEDALLFTSVGRLVWAKGYEDFIHAFTTVAKRLPNSFAAIVGDGALRSTLEDQIKNAGMEDRIRLLGHCDVGKTWSVMKASDYFVLTSRSEGVPYALLEAAAVGLPIITTRCGGIPDIFSDDVNALLVPIGDPVAISAAMLRVNEDQSLARRIASNARETIHREYSITSQIAAIEQAYAHAIERRQARNR